MDEKGKGLMSSFGFAAKEVFLIVSQTFGICTLLNQLSFLSIKTVNKYFITDFHKSFEY